MPSYIRTEVPVRDESQREYLREEFRKIESSIGSLYRTIELLKSELVAMGAVYDGTAITEENF